MFFRNGRRTSKPQETPTAWDRLHAPCQPTTSVRTGPHTTVNLSKVLDEIGVILERLEMSYECLGMPGGLDIDVSLTDTVDTETWLALALAGATPIVIDHMAVQARDIIARRYPTALRGAIDLTNADVSMVISEVPGHLDRAKTILADTLNGKASRAAERTHDLTAPECFGVLVGVWALYGVLITVLWSTRTPLPGDA